MNILENFSQSKIYTRQLLGLPISKLLILIVLSIIPLINFIIIGYCGEVLKKGKSNDLPASPENGRDLIKLFIQGLKIVLVGLIYTIPVVVVGAATTATMISNFSTGQAAKSLVTGSMIGGGIIVAAAVIVIYGVFVPLGVMHMLRNQKFSKAFAFSEIINILKTIGIPKYITWGLGILIIELVIAIVVLVISIVTVIIPFFGAIIASIISIFMGIFMNRSLITLYLDNVDDKETEE